MSLFLFCLVETEVVEVVITVYISFPYKIYNIVCLYIYVYILVIFIIRLGSACNQVAAVLFKLQACVQLGMNKKACTSKLCQWNVSRRKAGPVPLQQMSFKRPRKGELSKALDPFEDPEPFSFKNPLLNNVSQSFIPLSLRQRYLPVFQNLSQKR